MQPIKQLALWKQHVAWKLIGLNVLVMLIVIWLAGVSVKDFACLLVANYQLAGDEKNYFFDRTMNFYLIRASLLAIAVAAIIHFVFIKKILSPLKKLTQSTRQLTSGSYPKPVDISSTDEIGELARHFNAMTLTLKQTEENRKRMLSHVSHDLRTPLSNLHGYLEALSNGVIAGDRELYMSLLEETRHITRLVEQLHQLAVWEDRQAGSIAAGEIQMEELIMRSAQSFQLELHSNKLELEMSVEPGILWSDEDGLKQVLTNLIQNAICYSTGPKIWLSGEAGPNEYRITVSNIGEPLPEPLQELVFERFYRADPARHRAGNGTGSGLGLAIVKEIVTKLGGNVGLISEHDKLSFWITIPCD
ncbi:sensor histidine kinase [Paenibacillus pinihumi]|uniref:sensor histidine kinase n=1 Tax=Paenibacillus pinihumi TaxID=669462 RepID=UPI00041349CC|nr:HAMP domain-containing sensor histidine kinase [Paenibacillus pinihumi]